MVARAVVGGMAALAAAMGIGRFAFTPLLPWMQADAGFDNAAAGWIAGLNYLGYLVGVLAAGLVEDATLRRRVLGLALAGVVATTALMALPGPVALWGAVRLLAGIASAGAFVMASASVVTVLAAQGRGHLAGLPYGGVGLGIAGSGVLVAVAAPLQGWPAAWLWLTAIAAVLAVAAWRLIPPLPPAPPHAAGGRAGIGPAMALLAGSYFCEGMGYIVTGTFLVAIIKQTPGLGAWAEWSWVAVGLAAFPSVFFWSALARRIGAVAALVWAHMAQAVGVALPTVSAHPAAVLVAAVLFGGTFLAITGLVLSIGGTLATGRAARMIAGLTAAFGLGQVIGPPIAGAIADAAGGFALPLRLAAAVVVLGGVLAALVPWARRNPQS